MEKTLLQIGKREEAGGRRRMLAWKCFSLSLVGVPIVLLYAPVVTGLVATWWNDPGASHGFLIPPLTFYGVWNSKASIFGTPALPDQRGLWVVLLGCLVFLAGKLGSGDFLCRVSLLILAAGLIWTFWGRGRLRVLLFSLLLLCTMIPPPTLVYSSVSGPLQLLASNLSATLAQSLGVTVYREGNQIYLAQIRLGVAEACSGLHSLAAMIIAALLLGSIYCQRWYKRAALLALSVPTVIGANVLRITLTAVIADHHPQLAMGLYHSFSGWLVFLIGFGVLLLCAWGLRARVPMRAL